MCVNAWFSVRFPGCRKQRGMCTVRLLVINRDDFRRFMETDSEVSNWFLGRLMFQLYGFEKKHKMLRGTAKEQYQAIVEHRPYIFNKVPLKHIASYIGIPPLFVLYPCRKNSSGRIAEKMNFQAFICFSLSPQTPDTNNAKHRGCVNDQTDTSSLFRLLTPYL